MNYEEEKEMYSLIVTSQKNPVPTFDRVFLCFSMFLFRSNKIRVQLYVLFY